MYVHPIARLCLKFNLHNFDICINAINTTKSISNLVISKLSLNTS